MMKIKAFKLTNLEMLKEILEFTYGIEESKMELDLAYFREHSIIRTQLFLITMKDIPTKVSVHLVRHSGTGQYHLVGSNRGDWKGVDDKELHDESVNRMTPINHVMILNAGHLIDMSRKRLCSQAEQATREVMFSIKNAVSLEDPDLASFMVRNCQYRNGICPEAKPCGYHYKVLESMIEEVPEAMYRQARNNKAAKEANKPGVN